MTVSDQRCDRCGRALVGPPADGIPEDRDAHRFLYHPGDFALRDDSGLLCRGCLEAWSGELGAAVKARCAICAETLTHEGGLYLYLGGSDKPWRLCAPHAADQLNTLRTVEPKLDPATFTLAGDWTREGSP